VPTDFSEYAEYAFTWAVQMAADWQAKFILFHATAPISPLAFLDSVYLPELRRVEADMLADAEKRMVEFVGKKGNKAVVVETRVVVGEPVSEICQAVGREQADLIIMGSHGRTGLAHVLLGSVAERVIRHASCPVLVARKPKEKSGTSLGQVKTSLGQV
jgi:nucleotide-binding universal stress UspA family protein